MNELCIMNGTSLSSVTIVMNDHVHEWMINGWLVSGGVRFVVAVSPFASSSRHGWPWFGIETTMVTWGYPFGDFPVGSSLWGVPYLKKCPGRMRSFCHWGFLKTYSLHLKIRKKWNGSSGSLEPVLDWKWGKTEEQGWFSDDHFFFLEKTSMVSMSSMWFYCFGEHQSSKLLSQPVVWQKHPGDLTRSTQSASGDEHDTQQEWGVSIVICVPPKAGWFISWKIPIWNWMMTGGTPMTQETTKWKLEMIQKNTSEKVGYAPIWIAIQHVIWIWSMRFQYVAFRLTSFSGKLIFWPVWAQFHVASLKHLQNSSSVIRSCSILVRTALRRSHPWKKNKHSFLGGFLLGFCKPVWASTVGIPSDKGARSGAVATWRLRSSLLLWRPKEGYHWTQKTYLVGGLDHVFFFLIHWEYSSQLTSLFFRGLKPPTSF